MERLIQGVDGPLRPEDLGRTLIHEHVFIDLRPLWSPPSGVVALTNAYAALTIELIGALRRDALVNLDNLVLDDVPTAVIELSAFRGIGGDTVIDMSLPDIGRDVEALRATSRLSGLKIIAGSGHYVEATHPQSLSEERVDSIAERLVLELEDGVGSTGIRTGILGEIGTSAPIGRAEEKVLQATGQAHLETGAPIAVHLSPPREGWWQGHEVLDILEEEGVPPERVLLSHLDNVLGVGPALERALFYQKELGERGCFIGYDGCGKDHYFPGRPGSPFPPFWVPSDQIRAHGVAWLVEAGLRDKILLSQDVGIKIELQRFGRFGYTHIMNTFSMYLTDLGLEQNTVERMLTDNARAFLFGM